MQTFNIKPKKGLTVKDPETLAPLKAAGENKPRNAYWLRRLQDGSVTEMAAKATTQKDTL